MINAHYCTDVLEPDDLTVIGFLFYCVEMIEYTQIWIWRENYMKTAWYSGKNELPTAFHEETFDYIKTGRYDEKFGPLNSLTTNQRMIKRLADGRVKDITSRFQKVENEKLKTESI